MTILVSEAALTVEISVNQPNLVLNNLWRFVLTSQYSHQPLTLVATVINSNDRYSTFQVTFPTGFGDEHKNGIYYWDLKPVGADAIEKGLIKIITEPGGTMGMVPYESGIDTEERVSEVFYRPSYI